MPESRPTTVIGIAGSLRARSYNRALLRAAADLMPSGSALVVESIRGIPLYDADLEGSEGIPPIVTALKDRIAESDGLLLATPEYNHSMPGVFKNAIDWLSRPAEDIPRVFGDRPVALMGASPGRFGTILSQQAWIAVIRTLGMRPWFGGSLMVPGASRVFGDEGALVDDAIRDRLRAFMDGFVSFVRAGQGG